MIDIRQGNCLDLIKDIEDNSIDLIVTSPPYNKGYYVGNHSVGANTISIKTSNIVYGDFKDNLEPEEYERQQRELLTECLRVIKPTGSIFYNHCDVLYKKRTVHPKWVYDYPLHQIIVWDRNGTMKLETSYFLPITEYVFWIQKGDGSPVKFNRQNAMFNSCIWKMQPDKANKFPAPFPIDLPLNCILTCTDEGDLVLDPYSGSGTTALACNQTGRNFIGFELNPDYVKMAEERSKNVIKSLF
ncbi:MAG: site-specific DNA-methyltransferase [Paludibacteraceae bacterium]|nr:site-specific DNA-methyltransferase [Paludibacteraceae bacterium]